MFEEFGFMKEYYMDNKYIGTIKCEKDREVCGYYGRQEEVLEEDVILDNKKKIKKGSKVVTQLHILCGKLTEDLQAHKPK